MALFSCEISLGTFRFLKENQLWLQHAFTDIVDAKAIAHYRSTLLSSLSQILQEVTGGISSFAAMPLQAP